MNQPLHSRRTSVLRDPAPVGPAQPDKGDEPAGAHLHVVRRAPRAHSRPAPTRLLLVAAAGLAVVVVFGLVYLHVVLAQRQILLDAERSQASAAQARYQQLRLQVAQLESPAAIIGQAEGRLRMSPPSSVTYVTGIAATGATTIPDTPAVTRPGPAGDADWPTIKAHLGDLP